LNLLREHSGKVLLPAGACARRHWHAGETTVIGGQRRPDFVDALLPTIVALIVFRLGPQIPILGLEPTVAAQLLRSTGQAVERVSIFALQINPLFGILILFELVKVIAPSLRRWERTEPRNAAKLARIVLVLALISALLQANGIVTGLQDVRGLVSDPGLPFRVSTTATLVAGTTFLTWLAWQITSRGLGSGVWLILIVPMLASLPQTVATLYEFQKQGIVPTAGVLWGAVFIIAAIAAVVALLLADGRTADTAPACAWSTVLAYSMLPWVVVPVGAIVHTFGSAGSVSWFEFGHPVRLVALALLIWLFVVLYARSCRRAGAPVPAVPSAVIAAGLAAVAIGSEALPTYFGVPVILSGQPLLVMAIVVTTVLRDWSQPARPSGDALSPRA
jgi:preprotein translocase subunit SecY